MRPRVVVAYNRSSGQGEISEDSVLEAAQDVCSALEHKGWTAELLALDSASIPALAKRLTCGEPCVVFNLCEGLDGDTGKEAPFASMLELLNVPFTGNLARSMYLCQDKALCKSLLQGRQVPTAAYVTVLAGQRVDASVPLPVIVKPAHEDGSLGIDRNSVVTRPADLAPAVGRVLERFGSALVESYLPGPEYNVSVVELEGRPQVLPVAELVFTYPDGMPPILTHSAKWNTASPEYGQSVPKCPAELSEQLKDELREIAIRTFQELGCRDYVRVDFRLDAAGRPMVIDVNPNPDISRAAGLARTVAAAGVEYDSFITSMVENAWTRNSK